MNSEVEKVGVEQMLMQNENYWSAWVNMQAMNLTVLPKNVERLFKRSLLLMHATKMTNTEEYRFKRLETHGLFQLLDLQDGMLPPHPTLKN